jgi:hypothetical protein
MKLAFITSGRGSSATREPGSIGFNEAAVDDGGTLRLAPRSRRESLLPLDSVSNTSRSNGKTDGSSPTGGAPHDVVVDVEACVNQSVPHAQNALSVSESIGSGDGIFGSPLFGGSS